MSTQRNLAVVFALAFGFVSLPMMAATDTVVTVEKTTTTKHHYVYYGEHQIYFAPESKTYYWQQSDGNWHSGTMLPSESQAYVKSGGTEIDLDTDEPFERHDWVVKHYKDKPEDSARDKDGHDHR